MMNDPHHGQRILHLGPALAETGKAVVAIHGRGAGPENILELASRLDRTDVTYYAPAAVRNTWYPESFLAEISRNEPYLTSALGVIDAVVSAIVKEGCPRSRIVLLGFSQGACLASEYAYRHAQRYGGLIVFSGGLIGPPGTTWTSHARFEGTPIFLGCSDVDAHVPKTRVDESAAVFTRMGGDVNEQIYPGMGHLVSDDEIAVARGILDQIPA
jgi:predicted esterase